MCDAIGHGGKARRRMDPKNVSVFGIFDSRYDLEEAARALQVSGFSVTDVSVLFAEQPPSGSRGALPWMARVPISKDMLLEERSFLPMFDLLSQIDEIVIPGLGSFVAAGPIRDLLSGFSSGGAVGGLGGPIIGAGVPEHEARRYEERVAGGGILILIKCSNEERLSCAEHILRLNGARNVSSSRKNAMPVSALAPAATATATLAEKKT